MIFPRHKLVILEAWVKYGLGSANENLPGFVLLHKGGGLGGAQNWNNAFLPAAFQGTHFRHEASPVLSLRPPRSSRTRKAGRVIGATDDIGLRAIEEPQPVKNLHAAILAAFGLHPDDSLFESNGRQERLTGVAQSWKVIPGVLS